MLTKFLNNSHETLNNKRNGFAITFEIMMVGLLVTFATIVIVYFSEVMNTQRFMYDLTASTCTAAARYGGNDSRAYEFQVRQSNPNASATSISDNANKYIQAIAKRTDQITGAESFVFEGAGEGGNYLTVSDSPEGGYVWVELSFRFGKYGFGDFVSNVFGTMNLSKQDMTYRIYLPTLMQSGELL